MDFPAYLPSGMSNFEGATLYSPGWHFGFNIPAFLVVMLLDGGSGPRHPRIRRDQQRHGPVENRRHSHLRLRGASFVKPQYWHPFLPTAGRAC